MKRALVCGAGGFIGNHLVSRLKKEGYWVCGADLKYPEYSKTESDSFLLCDLRNPNHCKSLFKDHSYDDVFQLAADMGGAQFIFTGEHDADIMHNSGLININMSKLCAEFKVKKLFYSSSACVYPAYNQMNPNNPKCSEQSAYPCEPDSEYGYEKIFSERLYLSFKKNYNLNVYIARFHNVFGENGTWKGGREKSPAAICRKIAMAKSGDTIEIWGDGEQTRSFLYIDECIEGVRRLMYSDFYGPVNIGSDEMISINNLVKMVSDIAGKKIEINHIPGPLGVRGRNSDNKLIKEKLGWAPSQPLIIGIEKLYKWVEAQIKLLK